MFATLAGFLGVLAIGAAIYLVIGSVLGAVFLRIAAHCVSKVRITFGSAFLTMLLAQVITIPVWFVAMIVLINAFVAAGLSETATLLTAHGCTIAINLLITAAVISYMHRIRFPAAILTVLMILLLMFAAFLAVGIVIGGLMIALT